MSVIDVLAIKNAIKAQLDDNNVVTGVPIDLSGGMSDRVKKVLKVHIERIPIQPSFFPAITIFTSDKDISQRTIARNGAGGKRLGTYKLMIAGIVFNPSFTEDLDDSSDDECEILMENIEELLRSNTNLDKTCESAIPSKITYHNSSYDEQTHMRVGILSLDVKVNY